MELKMKKLSIMLLVAILVPMSSVYAETQPTLEGAHGFIKEMAEQKRLLGMFEWGIRAEIENLKSENCETSYSNTRVTGRDWNGPVRTFNSRISWGKVSSVLPYYNENHSANMISLQEVSTYYYYVTDKVTGERLVKAMDFLRQQCDTTKSKYGF